MSRRIEVSRCKCRSRQTIEDCQVLRARQDIATDVVFFFLTRPRILESDSGAFGLAIVGLRIPYYFARSIGCSVSRLASNLCSAIAVKIVDHELGVMSALANVPAKIDTP